MVYTQSSQKVKDWRVRTKARIIDSMGGKCVCCGYDKYQGALECHHLDPPEKEFRFGGIRANPIRWLKICEELRKCVLVCSNCHKEVEAGITILPQNAARFDERFVEYKIL